MEIDKSFEELKDRLINRRKELTKRLNASQKKAMEVSGYEGDDVDKALNAEDREMAFAMGSRERQEIKAIDNALKNISLGKYGSCDECGRKIAKKRLKILPFTKYCKDCQAEIELENKQNNR